MKAWCEEFEAANAALTKRKSRKRKRLQIGRTISTKEARELAAKKASTTKSKRLKAREGSKAEGSAPRQRRYGRYGGTGHNARTCKNDEEIPSESEATSICLFSDSDAAESAIS